MLENLIQELIKALNENTTAVLSIQNKTVESVESDAQNTPKVCKARISKIIEEVKEEVKEEAPVAEETKSVETKLPVAEETKSVETKLPVATIQQCRSLATEVMGKDILTKAQVQDKIKDMCGGVMTDLSADQLSELHDYLENTLKNNSDDL